MKKAQMVFSNGRLNHSYNILPILSPFLWIFQTVEMTCQTSGSCEHQVTCSLSIFPFRKLVACLCTVAFFIIQWEIIGFLYKTPAYFGNKQKII